MNLFESESSQLKFIFSWNAVAFSNIIDEFPKHMISLHDEFSSLSQPVQYATSPWLEPYKGIFVASWTDTYRYTITM